MKRLFASSIAPAFTFILSVLAILVIAVSAPGMVQAVLGPTTSLPGNAQPGASIQASEFKGPLVNPAAQIGTLADTGVFGSVGIGTVSPVSPLHILSSTSTQPETIDLTGLQPITAQWNDYCDTGGAFSGSGFLARYARGTKANPANVQPGDRLGFNVFGGWAGTGFKHTGAIEAIVGSGTISDTSLPTYMKFSTTPDGSASRLERMRITPGGTVAIGTTSPSSNMKLEVVNEDTASGTKAIYAESDNAGTHAIAAYSVNGYGIYGQSVSSRGVYGQSDSGDGVYGKSTSGYAGYFEGNARVTENLTTSKVAYSSARTHYYSLAGADFDPSNSAIGYSRGGGSAGAYITSGTSNLAMTTPVQLPDGAVVTEFKVYFYDTSVTYDLSVYLDATDFAGNFSGLAALTSAGISGYGSASDPSIDNATINNTNTGYFIWAVWPAAAGTNLQITGARITYTITEAE